VSSPFLLEGESFEALHFNVRRSGLFEYVVAADRAVSVYLIDEEDIEEFQEGELVETYRSSNPRLRHRGRVLIVPGGYYLVIENPSGYPAAVQCDVYY